MKYGFVCLLLGLMLSGCGGSSERNMGSFSDQSNVGSPAGDFSVEASGGSIRFLANQVHFRLDGLNQRISIDQGRGGVLSLPEWLAQAQASTASPRPATLEYRVGAEIRTVQVRITRGLLKNDGSLSISGYVGDGSSVGTMTPTLTEALAFGKATLRVGQPPASSRPVYGHLLLYTSDTNTIRAQSQDPHQSFDQTVSPGYINVPVDDRGSDYKFTVAKNGFQDCSFVNTLDPGEESLSAIQRLAPNGAATDNLTAQVKYEDLFNADANNVYVEFTLGGQLVFSGFTNRDGKISFSGVETGVSFVATAFNEDLSDVSFSTVQAGQAVTLPLKSGL